MKEKLAKLVDLKSIVTLVMTIALVALLFIPTEPNKEVLTLYCTSYGAVIALFL